MAPQYEKSMRSRSETLEVNVTKRNNLLCLVLHRRKIPRSHFRQQQWCEDLLCKSPWKLFWPHRPPKTKVSVVTSETRDDYSHVMGSWQFLNKAHSLTLIAWVSKVALSDARFFPAWAKKKNRTENTKQPCNRQITKPGLTSNPQHVVWSTSLQSYTLWIHPSIKEEVQKEQSTELNKIKKAMSFYVAYDWFRALQMCCCGAKWRITLHNSLYDAQSLIWSHCLAPLQPPTLLLLDVFQDNVRRCQWRVQAQFKVCNHRWSLTLTLLQLTSTLVSPYVCFLKLLKETEGSLLHLAATSLLLTLKWHLTPRRGIFLSHDSTSEWFRRYIFDSCWENTPHMGVGDPDK